MCVRETLLTPGRANRHLLHLLLSFGRCDSLAVLRPASGAEAVRTRQVFGNVGFTDFACLVFFGRKVFVRFFF